MVMDKGRTSVLPAPLPRRSSGVHIPIATTSISRKDNPYPLQGKDIVLDLMNQRTAESLKKDIRRLGGGVVDFISEERPAFVVVSDHPVAMKLEHKGLPIDPQVLKKLPLLLREAYSHKVKIRHVKSFTDSLVKAKDRSKNAKNLFHLTNAPVKPARPSMVEKIRILKEPFVKFEDSSCSFSPAHKELGMTGNWSTLYLGKYFGQSLFHKASAEHQERRERQLLEDGPEYFSPIKKPTQPKPNRPTKGFCEICAKQTDNMKVHFASREHISVINRPGFYDEIDVLLGSYVDHITCPAVPRQKRVANTTITASSTTTDGLDYEYSEGPYCMRRRSNSKSSFPGC